MKIHFHGCNQLDYEDNYGKCTKGILNTNVVFWVRPEGDIPRMVQFCKKRGRLNNPMACTSQCEARCFDYNEIQHTVEV